MYTNILHPQEFQLLMRLEILRNYFIARTEDHKLLIDEGNYSF